MRRDIIKKIAPHRGLIECIDRIEKASTLSQKQYVFGHDSNPNLANEAHLYTYILRYINELEERIKKLEK